MTIESTVHPLLVMASLMPGLIKVDIDGDLLRYLLICLSGEDEFRCGVFPCLYNGKNCRFSGVTLLSACI